MTTKLSKLIQLGSRLEDVIEFREEEDGNKTANKTARKALSGAAIGAFALPAAMTTMATYGLANSSGGGGARYLEPVIGAIAGEDKRPKLPRAPMKGRYKGSKAKWAAHRVKVSDILDSHHRKMWGKIAGKGAIAGAGIGALSGALSSRQEKLRELNAKADSLIQLGLSYGDGANQMRKWSGLKRSMAQPGGVVYPGVPSIDVLKHPDFIHGDKGMSSMLADPRTTITPSGWPGIAARKKTPSRNIKSRKAMIRELSATLDQVVELGRYDIEDGDTKMLKDAAIAGGVGVGGFFGGRKLMKIGDELNEKRYNAIVKGGPKVGQAGGALGVKHLGAAGEASPFVKGIERLPTAEEFKGSSIRSIGTGLKSVFGRFRKAVRLSAKLDDVLEFGLRVAKVPNRFTAHDLQHGWPREAQQLIADSARTGDLKYDAVMRGKFPERFKNKVLAKRLFKDSDGNTVVSALSAKLDGIINFDIEDGVIGAGLVGGAGVGATALWQRGARVKVGKKEARELSRGKSGRVSGMSEFIRTGAPGGDPVWGRGIWGNIKKGGQEYLKSGKSALRAALK